MIFLEGDIEDWLNGFLSRKTRPVKAKEVELMI